jgi:hypothetical protein
MTMKRLAIRTIVAISALLVMAPPVFATNQFYSTTLWINTRWVPDSGYYYLSNGYMYNYGQMWKDSWDAWGHTPTPNRVYLTVYNSSGGWVGECSAVPPTNGSGVDFYCSHGWKPAGNYRIKVWKVSDDGWNIGIQGNLVTSTS